MEEIKVGEYIRTSKGYMFYIDRKEKLQGLQFLDVQYGKIAKHSENIIDLIEIKDIVYLRNLKGDVFDFKAEIFDDKTMLDFKIAIDCNEVKLLSIVTHEQFEQVEYKI